MDYSIISPYIRRAMYSKIPASVKIDTRIILDYELIYVRDGLCRLECEGKVYECGKGDIIFLRPGVPHSIESIGKAAFDQPHIHFDMCTDQKSPEVYVCFSDFDGLSEKDRDLLRKDIVDIDIPAVFHPEKSAYFGAQFTEIIELFSHEGRFYQLLCKEKFLHLLYMIFSLFDKDGEKDAEGADSKMISIKNYIDNNYTQKLSLDVLEQYFCLNKFYIEVCFKKTFGVTVIKYYNNVRFENACKLLKAGSRVGETADVLGFDNIYSFSRFFKSFSGISPRLYTESLKNKENI